MTLIDNSAPKDGEATAATVVENGYGEQSSFSPFDMTYAAPHIFWLLLSFGLLFLVLWKIILPRLASTLEERNDRIADDLDQAATMKSNADAADRAYLSALADSKTKAHAIAAKTRAKLDEEITAETAQAEAEFAEKALIAEKQIRQATEQALTHVGEIAAQATSSIIHKLSNTKPSAASVKQAVNLASK